jgi:pilus assembly protein Flp/PilA
MQNFLRSLGTFLADEDGPTTVEYSMMLALIIIVCLIAIVLTIPRPSHVSLLA